MKSPLMWLLGAAFLNAIAWIVIIPLWQYPDEQAHFAQIQYVAEKGSEQKAQRLLNTSYEVILSEEILGTKRDESGNNKYTYHPQYKPLYTDNLIGESEGKIINLPKSARSNFVKNEATSNPPLYYTIAAQVYKLAAGGSLLDRVFALRFLSSFLYLFTLYVVFTLGKLIFEKRKAAAIALTSQVAFMPMFVFSETGVLPDPLTNFLFTLIIYLCLKILTQGIEFKTIIFTAVVFALGVLTRQHFLIALPIIASVLLFRFYKAKQLRKFLVVAISIVTAFYLIEKFGTVYPIISNFRIPDISNLNPKLLLDPLLIDHTIWTVKHTYSEVLPWYWGVYKWLSLTLPHIYYQVINRVLLVSLAGLVIYLFLVIKNRKISRENLIVIFMTITLAIYFSVFLIWDYFFRSKNTFSFGIQGRYFFPLISSQMLLLLIGIRQMAKIVFRKYTKYTFLLLAILMIIANDFSLVFVASSYYNTQDLHTFILEASQYKPALFKGNNLILILVLAAASQAIFAVKFTSSIIRDK